MTMHRQWLSPGRRVLALGAVASMAGGAALASTVGAQANSLLAVTSTADVADATPGDATCDTPALSAAAGACTFRAAARTAQNLSGTTTIQLPAGTITLKLGEIPTDSNVIIVGQGVAQTTIDAAKKSRVLDTDCTVGTAHTVALSNLTLQNGDATKPGLNVGIGGGIITCGTMLSLNNVLIQKNHASFGGGVATYAPLTVTGSTFHMNSAAGG
ncbi:MAG TPA: hypothetical protein VGR61_11365, partial [Candidatus Dormibacteraeota bacterium]|nr:hypothetical protein [Candidatus Dormibacteraeota bacterium]